MDRRLKQHELGYWEIADKPTPQELRRYYAEKYYQDATGSYELEYSEAELAYFNAKLEQRWAVLRNYLPNDDESIRLLDVGCGEGYALAYFRKKGWSVKGFDFSSAGVESKNPACLDALVAGDVFELLAAEIGNDVSYDVVWLQNVLEHVLEPLDLLSCMRKLLVPGGLAVITVPNDCSITQRAALDGKHVSQPYWVAPPDHLTYFDHESLRNAAIATGWECLATHGDFPIDWYLFHPGSNYVNDKAVGKAAHLARVELENLIHSQPIEDVNRFWAAAANLGIGRDITIFLRATGSP